MQRLVNKLIHSLLEQQKTPMYAWPNVANSFVVDLWVQHN